MTAIARSRGTILVMAMAVALAGAVSTVEANTGAEPGQASVGENSLACRARAVLPEGRPRIGLVLGGGGARGIAHVGVLRALEAAKVPVDCIAGTSMGALVGGLYASGIGVDELEDTVLALDWARMFDDSMERRERSYRRKSDDRLVLVSPGVGIGGGGLKLAGGLVSGERIMLMFSRLLAPVALAKDFDRLPIPFRAVAADINTGDPYIMGRGDLALAMRASMSLPGVFPPVQIDDLVLVDGGVARNLPIDVVRSMGADIVIAVDVGTPLGTVNAGSSALAIASQVTGLLTTANTRTQLATLGPDDVLISPPLARRVGTADFDKAPEALEMGRQGAAAAADHLARLALAPEDYAWNVAARTTRHSQAPVIGFIRLANSSRYSDAVLLARLDLQVGEPLDTAVLDASLYRLYGIETFAQVRYEVVEEGGQVGVVVHAEEKVQGPNYLEAGLSLNGHLGGDPGFGVRLGILQSPVNASGGELRHLLRLGDETGLSSEYYQPFAHGGRSFFTGRIEYENRRLPQFDANGDRLAEFDIRQGGVTASVGREFSNLAAVGVGLRRYRGDVSVAVGDPEIDGYDFDVGEAFVELAIDRLDSPFFPRDGYLLRAAYTHSHPSLGADGDFGQFKLDALMARARGPLALQAGVRYYTTTSGHAPMQSLFRLGGYSRLVGFQPNEVSGQHAVVLLSGASYRIAKVLNQEALAGILLEYGNAWQQRNQIAFDDAAMNASVYIGLDSWVGPIIFGVGFREQGEHNIFLELGHAF